MSQFSAIDLSKLAPPDVIEVLDFDSLFQTMLADLVARDATFSALVPSDPAYKILEVAAYRELLLRQRINEASQRVMLAFACGHDLDHLAALFGVSRLLLEPAAPTALPPRAAVWEDDERLRKRVALSLEGFSTAGPIGAYRYHGLAASAQVKDISVMSPAPGDVLVTVLSTQGNGVPDAALLGCVEAALNDEWVRPLTDHVIVQAATIVNYRIVARLHFANGPDPTVVLHVAREALLAYTQRQHALGQAVPLSALYAVLHQPGVVDVTLESPTATLSVTATQAAFCEAIVLSREDHDDA